MKDLYLSTNIRTKDTTTILVLSLFGFFALLVVVVVVTIGIKDNLNTEDTIGVLGRIKKIAIGMSTICRDRWSYKSRTLAKPTMEINYTILRHSDIGSSLQQECGIGSNLIID
jgi:hypothetical protein